MSALLKGKKRVSAFTSACLAAVLGLAGLGYITAPAANAAQCGAGPTLCMYEHGNYGGAVAKIYVAGSIANLGTQGLDNKMSSAINQGGQLAYYYKDRDFKGALLTHKPHCAAPSMPMGLFDWWDNNISSVTWY